MHDSRAFGSFAVVYTSYPRGACHRGCSHYIERSAFSELGYNELLNPQLALRLFLKIAINSCLNVHLSLLYSGVYLMLVEIL